MPPTTLADLPLARRVERAWAWAGVESARAFGLARPGLGVAIEEVGGGAATYYGPGSPLSQAQGLGLGGPVADADLDRLEAFYDARGVATTIEVASLADPAFLPQLSGRGYRVAEQTHMLTLALDGDDPGAEDRPAREGLTVVRAEGAGALAEWSGVVLRGFFPGPGEPPDGLGEVMGALTAAPSSSAWLARFDGPTPAGGAVLLGHGDLGLFAGDATLPALRGLGVQAALIRARLAAARGEGFTLAVVCTAPGSASQRNYERFGFRLVYARTLMAREPRGAALS